MRRPPRSLPLAALGLALAGCASNGSAPIESANTTTQSTTRVDGGAATFQAGLTHSDPATENALPVSPDRAFAVLPLVYEQLGLKINTAVSDSRTVGVNAVRTRRVGKEPMSRYVSCGTDVTGMSLADSYGITLTVMSRVTAAGAAGSLLSTQVLAIATPMSTSGNPITCQSTGALEALIAKAAASRAAG